MEPIIIAGTTKSPDIKLDAKEGLIELSGMSYAEDTFVFYEPIFDWINDYARKPSAETTLNMKVKYFNTSSIKCMFDILEAVANIGKEGHKTTINWFYDEEDEEMKDCGENFSNILNFPFNILIMES